MSLFSFAAGGAERRHSGTRVLRSIAMRGDLRRGLLLLLKSRPDAVIPVWAKRILKCECLVE
jgi:hypothetical protein